MQHAYQTRLYYSKSVAAPAFCDWGGGQGISSGAGAFLALRLQSKLPYW